MYSCPPACVSHPHTHTEECGTSTAGHSARGLTSTIEMSRVTGCLPTDGLSECVSVSGLIVGVYSLGFNVATNTS